MESLPGTALVCSYEVDPSLRLVAVDVGWTQFAVANGAPHLVPPAPLGRSLLEFFSDPTTRYVYAELFRRLATVDRPITLDIRCDSPELRRWLALTIAPHAGGFSMDSRLLRTEPNPGGRLLEVDAPRDPDRLLRVCSWCKRVDVHGSWLELEDGVPRLRVFDGPLVPAITHGMCEACHARVMDTLAGL